ncbi:MAG: UDP-glucose 6-dehydrogenase, partial [Mycobacterium sp.]
ELDPADLAETVRTKVVVDGRNCLDVERWSASGWRVFCLGKSPRQVSPPSLV